MNIVLLQDDDAAREKMAFVLEGQFNAMVYQAASSEQARQLLKERHQEIHLLVIDFDRARSRDVDKLRAEFTAIRSIVFLQGPQDKPLAISAPPGHPAPVFLDRSDIVDNLLKAVGEMVKEGQLPNPEDDRNFCKIRTKLLLAVCPLEADIYIRLSEAKYLKLFRQGDTFDLQDMEKYTVKKGVEYLYIRKNNISDFVRKFRDQLLGLLARKPEMSLEEVARANGSIYETIQELGGSMGFTQDVQEMAKAQVALTVKAMGKSPRLSSILEKLDSFQGKYIASHSTMCAYFACSIASHMKWGSETTFQKLTLAAFLHDVTLTNHDLAACETLDEVKGGSFTDEERKAFAQHTIKGAEIAKQFHEVPPDVDAIIAQHHERPDGAGFPRGLAATYIAPLTAIFIVAHDLTRFVLKKGKGVTLGEFIEDSRERYKPSQFRKVLQAVEQLEAH